MHVEAEAVRRRPRMARGWAAVQLTCMMLAAHLHATSSAGTEKELIGWLGETYKPGTQPGGSDEAQDPSGMSVLSWSPRIFHYRRFLTPEECEHLRDNAKPMLRRSGVVNPTTGQGETSDVRTSSGMFFDRGGSDVISRIEERIARWTMLPVENGESLQVLQYQNTQEYRPHNDYFSFKAKDDNGGNRMATVLMYLGDVEEGGETVFPKVPVPPGQKAGEYSECAMKGMAVKPRMGDAVLFWSIKPEGTFDWRTNHGSCPVIKGVKWTSTKWIHVGRYDGMHPVKVVRTLHVPSPPPALPGCRDMDTQCEAWAEEGECENNPKFMVGTKDMPGSCLLSCARCDLMVTAASEARS